MLIFLCEMKILIFEIHIHIEEPKLVQFARTSNPHRAFTEPRSTQSTENELNSNPDYSQNEASWSSDLNSSDLGFRV